MEYTFIKKVVMFNVALVAFVLLAANTDTSVVSHVVDSASSAVVSSSDSGTASVESSSQPAVSGKGKSSPPSSSPTISSTKTKTRPSSGSSSGNDSEMEILAKKDKTPPSIGAVDIPETREGPSSLEISAIVTDQSPISRVWASINGTAYDMNKVNAGTEKTEDVMPSIKLSSSKNKEIGNICDQINSTYIAVENPDKEIVLRTNGLGGSGTINLVYLHVIYSSEKDDGTEGSVYWAVPDSEQGQAHAFTAGAEPQEASFDVTSERAWDASDFDPAEMHLQGAEGLRIHDAWFEVTYTSESARYALNVPGLGAGTYNYTIYSNDSFGNTASLGGEATVLPELVAMNISVIDSGSAEQPAVIQVLDSNNNVEINGTTTDLSDMNSLEAGTKTIIIEPINNTIQSIEIYDANISAEVDSFIKIDNPEDSQGHASLYAIDPTALNFTSANVTVSASGTELWKCKDWDFDAQSCNGEWVFLANIVPGEMYTFTLTPEDPGFKEDFSGNYTASGYAAWKSTNAVAKPPSSGPNVTNEAVLASAEYTNISASDTSWALASGTGYRAFRFEFNITQPASTINNISYRWTGYSTGSGSQPVNMYLWNYTGSSWFNAVNNSQTTGDYNLTYTLASGISNFINSSGKLTFIVETASPGSTYILYTNYVSINISDATPPASVTGLANASATKTSIYWTWTNPADSDFNSSIVYIDGVNLANTSSAFYNATGFTVNTSHMITIYTKDNFGNINNTNVSSTASTMANILPTQTTPILNSTLGTNTTSENLTCYNQSTADANGEDSVKNIFNWYKGGASIMVLNMPFEGGSNSTFTKNYAQRNNGSVYGAAWVMNGGYDGKGAYNFTVEGQNITLGDFPEIEGARELSGMMWFKTNDLTRDNLLMFKGLFTVNSGPFMVWRDDYAGVSGRLDTCSIELSNGTNTTRFEGSSGLCNTTGWTHLAWTFNGSAERELRVYVNGVEDTTPLVTDQNITFLMANSYDLILGRSHSALTNGLVGLMDDVRIYNSTLSPEQIKAIYNNRSDLIVSQELAEGQNWSCAITPNDGTGDGSTLASNSLTIKPFGSLNVSLLTPTPGATTNVTQNQTFWVNATVTCNGGAGALCGNITAYARYNITTDSPPADWWNSSWRKRNQINISSAVATTLTNFPIYLNVSKAASMQADFDDLRFVNGSCSSGNTLLLDYEIENYTGSNANVWVRIPSLPSTGAKICMYYDNSAAGSGQNRTGVWDANYVGVWHLNENVTDEATTGIHNDSTSNGNNGKQSGNAQGAGKVASGQAFDGINDYINASTSPGSAVNLTIEYWMKPNVNNTYMRAVGKEINGTQGWSFLIRPSGDAGFDRAIIFRIGSDANYGAWGNEVSAQYLYNANQWVHIAGTFAYNGANGGTGTLYVNGTSVASKSNTDGRGVANTNAPFLIGLDYSTYPSTEDFNGIIDEVRISNIARSADWINQSYRMVANQNSYVATNGEEALPTIESMTAINTTAGATPLRSLSSQPQSCTLNQGQSCQLNWSVNATGAMNSQYKINVNFSSSYSEISANQTANATINILSDSTPPASVTSLANISATFTSIYWTWTNPGDADFSTNIIYIDGVNLANTSSAFYNATGFTQNTSHMITVYTKDNNGNINSTNVSNTGRTLLAGTLGVSLITPASGQTTNVTQNQTFWVNATVTCNGGAGALCGNITAYARYNATVDTQTLWTPAQIATTLWLDANDSSTITNDSSRNISNWRDKSSGFNFTQSNATYKPKYNATAFNGMPAVVYDGIDDELDATIAGTSANNWTAFAVIDQLPNSKSFQYVLISGAGTILSRKGGGGISFKDNYGTYYSESTPYVTGKQIIGWQLATNGNFYRNGTSVYSTPWNYTALSLNGTAQISASAQGQLNMSIVELLVLPTKISDEDRQKIEGYLAWKWGLEGNLPADHPYKSAAPTIMVESVTAINTTAGATPLRSLSSQPQSCALNQGQSCQLNWSVNATGAMNSQYKINVNFSSSYSEISNNETNNATVRIYGLDTTPPASVTALTNISATMTSIYWTWTNPVDTDYNISLIYIDGVNVANTSSEFYNATGFTQNTTHTITIYTRDNLGNINNTDVSNTGRTLLDTFPPASVTALTNISSTMTSIYWTWTNPVDSDYNISLIYIDGVNVLNSTTPSYNGTGFTQNTTHMITIYTMDNLGNLNNTNVSNTGRTLPDIYPSASVTGLTNASATMTSIYWTWTNPVDSDFNSSIIYIDGVNVANTSSEFYNATGFTQNTLHTITVYTKDNLGNLNNTDVSNTAKTLLDTRAPAILFASPTSNSSLLTANNYILANVTANDTDLNSITIRLYNLTGALINSSTEASNNLFVNFSGLDDGIYYFNATAYDEVGNSNSTETRNITIDTTAPSAQYVFPTYNSSYYTAKAYILVNVTSSDAHFSNITAELYNSSGSMVDSSTGTSAVLFANFSSLADGIYYFNATAYDALGNSQPLETRNVTIDTIKPISSFIAPTTASGTVQTSPSIVANVSVAEANPDHMAISLYDSNMSVINTSDSTYADFSGLPDGLYYFSAIAYDLAGNQNSTETRNVTIDTINPTVSFVSPTPVSGSYTNSSSISYNITASDSSLNNVTVSLFNSSGSLVNSSVTASSGVYGNFPSLDDGIYYFNATATDSAGNSNSTETRTVTVDSTAPFIMFVNVTTESGT
ncbi:MAG: DUF2341 domain-containing protein, partial [Candidatus Micrarchaeota archaeon]|nr:DUF2341 domain-containing protein [Candidatus Micrarchaeota archaeon]